MTIKGIDEAVLRELKSQADRQGLDPEAYAKELLRQSLALRRGSRAAKARAILASQPDKAEIESTVFIREERQQRETLTAELRDIRAMTLKPLVFDSTLVIREMRDRG